MDNEVKEITEKPQKKKISPLAQYVCDFLDIVVTSVATVIVIFTFFARVAIVNGTSMNDTLQHQDGLIVSDLFYTPKCGDIIVCQTEFFGMEEPIVKRVIATEGQTVSIDFEKWEVTVDGVVLEENYVKYIQGLSMNGWDYGESYTVPEGYVFCMGDNRNGSWDCRDSAVGPIDERYIIGKVILRYLPFNNFTLF